jgi:uncharacterized protein
MRPVTRAGLLLACLAASAFAVDWKSYKPQGYVSDFAGVVDARSRAAIDSYAANVQRATGAQMALVAVPSLEGEPIEDVANDIFHAWGVGQKGQDNGVMLLLSIGDRKTRLEVGGGLGDVVQDTMAGDILNEMRPALRQRQYGPALLAAAEKIGSTIAQSKGVSIAMPSNTRRVRRTTRDQIPWPLILFGIFFLLMILRGGGHRGGRGGYGGGGGGFWTGLLLGQILNSGRRYSGGGGGFGGYDSGDSGGGFGGFGGGDSAGGGASSDW